MAGEIKKEVRRNSPKREPDTTNNDTCRCKQTAQMKPGELLRLMMKDLAFWKKTKQ